MDNKRILVCILLAFAATSANGLPRPFRYSWSKGLVQQPQQVQQVQVVSQAVKGYQQQQQESFQQVEPQQFAVQAQSKTVESAPVKGQQVESTKGTKSAVKGLVQQPQQVQVVSQAVKGYQQQQQQQQQETFQQVEPQQFAVQAQTKTVESAPVKGQQVEATKSTKSAVKGLVQQPQQVQAVKGYQQQESFQQVEPQQFAVQAQSKTVEVAPVKGHQQQYQATKGVKGLVQN